VNLEPPIPKRVWDKYNRDKFPRIKRETNQDLMQWLQGAKAANITILFKACSLLSFYNPAIIKGVWGVYGWIDCGRRLDGIGIESFAAEFVGSYVQGGVCGCYGE
jgi:hypothetical protein